MSRVTDNDKHPVAAERERRQAVRFWAGLVIAAAGLVVVFWLKEVYVGFTVALVGAGLVPLEKVPDLFRGLGKS